MKTSFASANLKVAVLQMTSIDQVETNLEVMLNELSGAWKAHGPFDLVTTPENSLFFRIQEGVSWPSITLESVIWKPLRAWAKTHRCAIHVGSVGLQIAPDTRVNSTIWISEAGEISAPYQKIHLFDVDVPGAPPVRESSHFQHGLKPAILEYRGWKLGLSICYDLRFSALYQIYQMNDVDAILIPSAFLVPTGKAHWEILLRARAIETQAFVIAAAQAGTHRAASGAEVGRETWGHSLVVGPWGDVILDSGPILTGIGVVELDHQALGLVRQRIPMKVHHRLSEPTES